MPELKELATSDIQVLFTDDEYDLSILTSKGFDLEESLEQSAHIMDADNKTLFIYVTTVAPNRFQIRVDFKGAYINKTNNPVGSHLLLPMMEVLEVPINMLENARWRGSRYVSPPQREIVEDIKLCGKKVYFIEPVENITNMVKIGISNNPDGRMGEIQTMSPVKLKIITQISGGYKKESELHAKFAHLRSHGEWFHKTPELSKFIDQQKESE